MQNMLMIGWLILTVWLIFIISREKSRIIPVCIIYYLICVIDDIFFVSVLELSNAFGFSYQMGDMIVLILLGVWIVDCIEKPYMKKNLCNFMLVVSCVLLFFSMISGFRSYGISPAWVGDLRTNATLIAPILFFGRFDVWDKAKNYRKYLDIVMMIILIISIILWGIDILTGFHPLQSQYNATLSDGGSTMRFVQSYNVLGISLYALLLLKENAGTKGYITVRTMLFIGAVILFQHRSVWLAFGFGAIATVLIEIKKGKIKKKFFLQMILIILGVICILQFGKGSIIENISNSVELLQKMINGEELDRTTAHTRNQVWDAVIGDLQGSSLLFGRPYGYGYATSIEWETSPHSGYIRFLARTGYIGVIASVCMLLYIPLKLYEKKNTNFIVYLVCILGFMYAFDYTWLCGATIGVCILQTNLKKADCSQIR